jgi:hypothetical protein
MTVITVLSALAVGCAGVIVAVAVAVGLRVARIETVLLWCALVLAGAVLCL